MPREAPTARLPLMGSVNEDGVMDRERATEILREHESELRARGVTRLELFGSLARGETTEGSDIDVVVDIEPGRKFSLIDLASLRVFLCGVFGRETDVLVREDMRPNFRRRIERETVRVL